MIAPALFLLAAILPPSIDDWKRADAAKPELPLPSVAREYGLAESDAAVYNSGKKSFQLAAYRLKDVTGAVALEQSLQAPDNKIFRYQNYVFQTLAGTAPRGALDAFLFPALAKVDRSAPPNLLAYLPAKGRIQASERLLIGPESLRAFEPRIPVVAAGFDFSGEIQLARYSTAIQAVFRFPNHAIARQQYTALQKISSGAITRQGPIVALVLPSDPSQPLSPETAQALAGQIQYKAELVMDNAPPKPQPNPALFLLGVFQLCGVLLCCCLGLGLIFAFFRAYGRHWSGKKHDDEMTTLGI